MYDECVFVCVALGTQHAKRMHRIVICSLPGSTVFFHIILQVFTLFIGHAGR